MTRKDYILIAAALKASRDFYPGLVDYPKVHDRVADKMADTLAAENVRFDPDRFLKAAGHSQY